MSILGTPELQDALKNQGADTLSTKIAKLLTPKNLPAATIAIKNSRQADTLFVHILPKITDDSLRLQFYQSFETGAIMSYICKFSMKIASGEIESILSGRRFFSNEIAYEYQQAALNDALNALEQPLAEIVSDNNELLMHLAGSYTGCEHYTAKERHSTEECAKMLFVKANGKLCDNFAKIVNSLPNDFVLELLPNIAANMVAQDEGGLDIDELKITGIINALDATDSINNRCLANHMRKWIKKSF